MSDLTLTTASWVSYLAQTTAQARAGVVAGWFPSGATIEFYDGSDTLIRTVTTAAWTVGAAQGSQYPVVPGVYTDAGTGAGTVSYAVFKDGSTERFRCTCGVAANNFYRLLANFASGVKLKRGNFALLVGPPPAVGNSEPVNTVAPSISGTATVGQVLTCTAGTWTGNPVPSVTRQWYRGASAISGATGLAYTLASADVGALITVRETATNVVGPRTATSNAIGPVSSGELAFTPPGQVDIHQSGTYSLAQHVSGGVPPYKNFGVDAGTLPTGVTLNASSGILSATAGATVQLSGNIDIGVDDSAAAPSPGILPAFSLMSAVGGTNLPFALGHAFKQGDVPAGQYVNSDLTDWQAVPTTYWPDGSLRHAIIAGRATCSANVLKSIALSVSGTNRSGTALTEADLASAMSTVTLAAGGDSFTLNSLIGTAARHRTVCSGPVMSSWLYRRAIAGSTNLVAWFEVRLYIGGAVEILPWAENGFLLGTNPLADTRTWTLTIGGVTKFSSSLTVRHRSRPLLLDNTAASFKHWSYWAGTTDPQIVPKHDMAYLRATGMVPNLAAIPSETRLNALPQSFAPGTVAGIDTQMGAAGTNSGIIGHDSNIAHAAWVSSSADARAYNASMAFGYSGGSWSTHYREGDPTLAINEPFVFTQRPNVSINEGSSPAVPAGDGNEVGTPVTTHQPSYGFLPWLLTGRWWFLEEQLFWTNFNYLKGSPSQRRGEAYGQNTGTYPPYTASASAGIIDLSNGAYPHRGGAWSLRCLAQTLAILPTTHPCYASIKASFDANVGFYRSLYITGAYAQDASSASYVGNALGYVGYYYGGQTGPALWRMSAFMNNMVCCVFPYMRELALSPGVASQLDAVVQHVLKWTVGVTGDASGWDYRWGCDMYETAIGSIDASQNFILSPSFADAFAKHVTINSLNTSPVDSILRYGNQAIQDYAGGWPYFGNHIMALAYAKDAGVAGASAAWSRMIAASNWPTIQAQFSQSASFLPYITTPRSA